MAMISSFALLVFSLAAMVDASSPYGVKSAAFASTTHPRHQHRASSPQNSLMMPHTTKLHMVLPSKSKATVAEIEAESEQLRKEIEELRKEALRRLEDLNEKLSESSTSTAIEEESIPVVSSSVSTTTTSADDEDLLPAPAPIVFTQTKSKSSTKKPGKTIANLLDETQWKVSLSIGREPGTWMPKEWGQSGTRINISFTAEFTPSQLYDRDDFFRGGYTNAKILHVVNNEIKLGPSVSEGERIYKVKDGGWQITRGDGPMGTDLLRFFIEVDEKIEHSGGDVYVPKGRVYCSCGYFPFMGSGGSSSGSSVKEAFTKELNSIEEQIVKLQKAKDEIKNPFNLEGIKISREIFRLNREAEQVANKINFMAVKDPDRSLLRFSKDEDAGLTKEGGVCCQVNKGPVVEYHILGRFGIASVD